MPWLIYHDDRVDVVQTQRNKLKVVKMQENEPGSVSSFQKEVINALFDDEDDELSCEGVERWRFNCSNVTMVGLTTKSEFAKSHRLRAFCYFSVGKLGDGSYTPIKTEIDDIFHIQSSLTTSDYGLPWPEISEVHLIAQRTVDSFKLSIIQDKRSLGLAYDLDVPICQKLYPIVRFSKPGEVAIFKLDKYPNGPILEQRDPEIFDGEQGFWSITQYGDRVTVKPYPVRLFKLDNDQFDLHIKVNNIISARLTRSPVGYRVDKTSKSSSPGDKQVIKDETAILECIASINNIKFGNDEETLIMENSRADITLKRFSRPHPEPIRSCPLRRLKFIDFSHKSKENPNENNNSNANNIKTCYTI